MLILWNDKTIQVGKLKLFPKIVNNANTLPFNLSVGHEFSANDDVLDSLKLYVTIEHEGKLM